MTISIILFSSCGPAYRKVSFNPDFRIAHRDAAGIGNVGSQRFIPFTDPRIDEQACMSIEKIKELNRLLRSCVIPEGGL